MKIFLENAISRFTQSIEKALLARKLKKYFSGKDFSFISSNCLGGRFSRILGTQYRSPTVGLYFDPPDFLLFLGDLQRNLDTDIALDEMRSEQAGYPVGMVNGFRIRMMHYSNFADARNKWNARKSRVDLSNTLFIFTDRDGATYEHLQVFDRLPFKRKIVFVHKPYPEIRSAVHVKGFENEGQVGELYSQWHCLNSALTRQKLKEYTT